MPSKSTDYIVIFDTNGLRGARFITDGLGEAMISADKSKLINVSYLLPEIVKDEWVNNYLNKAQHQYLKIDNARTTFEEMGITGHSLVLPENIQLVIMAETYLTNMGFEFITTPYANIDFPTIVQRAVNHLSPFSEDGDKGFKDALIGLTIRHAIDTDSVKKHKYILISRDENFIGYINELIPNPNKLQIFPSMNQFQSHVELELNNLSQDLAKEAKKLLIEKDNKSTLWYTESLGKRIVAYYDNAFSDPEEAVEYIQKLPSSQFSPLPISPLSFFTKNISYSFGKFTMRFGETTFEDRENQILHWSIQLFYTKEYIIERGSSLGYLGDQTEKLTHNLVYTIKWTTKLNNKLELEGAKLISIAPTEESKTSEILTNQFTNTPISFSAIANSSDVGTDSNKKSIFSTPSSLLSTLNNLKEPTGPDDSNNALRRLLKTHSNRKHFWDMDGKPKV